MFELSKTKSELLNVKKAIQRLLLIILNLVSFVVLCARRDPSLSSIIYGHKECTKSTTYSENKSEWIYSGGHLIFSHCIITTAAWPGRSLEFLSVVHNRTWS